MIRKILLSNNPILRRKSKPVTKIDKKVKDLIKDLKDTLGVQKEPEGVGLAAPQIGKNLRIFAANYKPSWPVKALVKVSKELLLTLKLSVFQMENGKWKMESQKIMRFLKAVFLFHIITDL